MAPRPDLATVKERAVSAGHLLWDLLMVGLALLSVGFIVWVEVKDLGPEDAQFRTLAYWDLAIVVLFLAEFVWRGARAPAGSRFIRHNWYELPGLVPLYIELLATQVGALAWLRTFRLLRVLRVMRLFRAVSAMRRLRHNVKFLNRVLEESRLGYTLLLAAGVVLGMAAVVWILERDSNDSFATYGDALWWAIVTATTVGYGDITPQEPVSRLLAGALMLVGIGLIGIVASSLSTAILSVGQKDREASPSPATASPATLSDELRRLDELRLRGVLSDDEFRRAKEKLLGVD